MKATVVAVTAILGMLGLGIGEVDSPEASQTGLVYYAEFEPGDVPFSGAVDLEFSLWDAESDGTQIGTTQRVYDVQVIDDLFEAELDFGPDIFTGQAYWLEIAVGSPAGSDVLAVSPRRYPLALTEDGVLIECAVPPPDDDPRATDVYVGALKKGQTKSFTVNNGEVVEIIISDADNNYGAIWNGRNYNNYFCGTSIKNDGTSAKTYGIEGTYMTLVSIPRGRAETYITKNRFRLKCTSSWLEYFVKIRH